MFLSQLTLRGFKSFAEKTTLKFEPGVTVIVGPNGSGKSNITDAFLWVMGEQKARTLRGSSMEDVIFHGSTAKNAVSSAEVSITLDNSDGMLPLEYSEVLIKRSLSRTGDSSYSINGTSCRLLDIYELLSDTAIGRDTYSIISQGRIEEILMAKPEDRRALIEEAANVLKHRRRKDKALRKLELLEANLLRISDIISEVERQLKPMKARAKYAVEFMDHQNELKTLTITYSYRNLERLKSEWQDLESKEGKIKEELSSDRSNIDIIEQDIELIQNAIRDKNIFDNPVFKDEKRVRDIKQSIDIKVSILNEKLISNRSAEYSTRDKIADLKSQLNRASSELERVSGDKNEKDVSLNDIYISLNNSRKLSESVKKERTELADRVGNLKAELRSLQESRAKLKEQAHECDIYLGKESTRLSFYEAEYKAFKESIKELEERISWLGANCGRDECSLRAEAMRDSAKEKEKEAAIAKKRDDLRKLIDEKVVILAGITVKRSSTEAEYEKITSDLADSELKLQTIIGQDQELTTEINRLHLQIQSVSDLEVRSKNRAQSLSEDVRIFTARLLEFESGFSLHALRNERYIAVRDLMLGLRKRAVQLERDAAEKVSVFEKEFYADQSKLRSRQDELKKAHELSDALQTKIRDLEIRKAEVKSDVGAHTERIVSGYNLTLDQASELVTDMDPDICKSRMEKIKRRMESMGPVNPIAVEELKEFEDRYEFLRSQFDDIRQSRLALNHIVKIVDSKIEQRFLEVYEKVNINFQEIISYVFPGGEAELQLTDENDPLGSGIEIKAAPPGKKMKNINLLSGGERTLVSLALLFAVYMIRPSPFYILDEVEAALDDINLKYFINLINRFKVGTQFIIITHQRRTMEVGDYLYGVTMQADGITKVISQDMTAAKELV